MTPLAPGFMQQRPGGVFDDVVLGRSGQPTAPLRPFRSGEEVRTTDQAEGMAPGMRGRVMYIAPFRSARQIGVRMQAPGWAPLVWFDACEIESLLAATLLASVYEVLDQAHAVIAQDAPTAELPIVDDDLPLMGGAR